MSELREYLDIGLREKSELRESDIGISLISVSLGSMISFLDTHFVLSACSSCNQFTHFEENIIKPGVSLELDEFIRSYQLEMSKLYSIRNYFMELMQNQQNQKSKSKSRESEDDTEYIKIYQTEKNGISLQITKTRSEILKKLSKEYVELDNGVSFLWKDVQFQNASKSNNEIYFPLLDSICRKITHLRQNMDTQIQCAYWKIVDKFESEMFSSLNRIIQYTSLLDVIICKVHLAKTYHYCCPQIVLENQDQENKSFDKSFVEATAIRHVLIEHIQQNELYVTNDLFIGNSDPDGILLYGTNAVGKTSLIRALGVAIIMAQSGMFVPCSQFRYKPYHSIYSRILGNDNLFKGLSTFAVEMSELRIILKYADKNSFILGDELCSGTETESALSIFMASLQELHEKKCSFLFATHFHEIVDYEELKELSRIHLKHLEVRYDAEHDCLVYDRKLKSGSGNRNYGLEVCKSLYLSNVFLEKAYAIRRKYYPENEGSLSKNTSRYNHKKIQGKCEMCQEKLGEEVHHLNPQKNADSSGYIGSFHKNHVANLMNICSKCHDDIHSKEERPVSPLTIQTNSPISKNIWNEDTVKKEEKVIKRIIRKKSTKGYILTESG
jgi:DNA mismatch repair protein MutS